MNGYTPEYVDKVRFFGGDMLIGLCYLILVRTSEYIKKELSDEEKVEVLKISKWSMMNVFSFNDLISRHSIDIIELTENKQNGAIYYSNDSEKIEYFMTRLRNSISHHRYTFTDTEYIILTDINPNNQRLEMECILNYSSFLNLIIEYFHTINVTLHKMHHS